MWKENFGASKFPKRNLKILQVGTGIYIILSKIVITTIFQVEKFNCEFYTFTLRQIPINIKTSCHSDQNDSLFCCCTVFVSWETGFLNDLCIYIPVPLLVIVSSVSSRLLWSTSQMRERGGGMRKRAAVDIARQ